MYKVVSADVLRDHLRTLADSLHGEQRRRLRETLAYIQAKLAEDPLNWGEPLYNVEEPPGVVCVAIRPPLVVHYTVYERARAVWLQAAKIIPQPGE